MNLGPLCSSHESFQGRNELEFITKTSILYIMNEKEDKIYT